MKNDGKYIANNKGNRQWINLFSSLMLVLSLMTKARKIFLKTAAVSVLCGSTMITISIIEKLMYMEPRVGEGLVPWKDVLLLVTGILILVIISERLQEN